MGHPLCLPVRRQLGHRRLLRQRPHAERFENHHRRVVHAGMRPARSAISRHYAQIIDLPDSAFRMVRDFRHGRFSNRHCFRDMGGGHGAAPIVATKSNAESYACLHARRFVFHPPRTIDGLERAWNRHRPRWIIRRRVEIQKDKLTFSLYTIILKKIHYP